MKTIFTLIMLVPIVIAGIVSFNLFENADYSVSALLVISSFISFSFWVYLMNHKKATRFSNKALH